MELAAAICTFLVLLAVEILSQDMLAYKIRNSAKISHSQQKLEKSLRRSLNNGEVLK